MIPNNHPVLESIQPCLLDLINSTTSEVLYANEFSGLPKVNLPEELVSIFESDFGLVGTNVLIQLENKMSGVPGGPWYLDSRNSCIYIHNRNFQDIPVYTYEYLANSGELIDISFKTNYVKRNTSGGIYPTVNKDKGMSLTLVSSPTLSFEQGPEFRNFGLAHYAADASTTKSSPIIDTEVISVRDTSNQLYTESLYGIPTPNKEALIDMYVQSNKDIKKTQAVFDTTINNARIEAYLKTITLDQLKEESQSIFQQTATNLGITVSELREQLQEAMDSGNLDQYLQRLYRNSYHIFNNPSTIPGYPNAPTPTTVKVHELDLFQLGIPYKGQHSGFGAHISVGDTNMDYVSINRGTYGTSYSGPSVEEAAQSAGRMRSEDLLNSLNNNPEVVILEVGDLKITTLPQDDPRYSISSYQAIYSQKVTVLVESQSNNYIVPTYRIISDLYTRQLDDPDATLKDVEAHVQSLLHANDEVLEKVITCKMTCIGNPFLASSQVLTINNVSSIWSGRWYIKKCKHTLNNSGYLCTLDLVLNSTIPSSSAVSTDISGEQSWDTDPSYEISINITSAEAIYYTSLYDKESDEDQVDFILRMIQNKTSGEYQDEFNDQGIVIVDHTTSSTTTGLEGQGVGAKYTLDSRVTEITPETRTKYERAAREAVFDNSLTDLMEQKVNENK